MIDPAACWVYLLSHIPYILHVYLSERSFILSFIFSPSISTNLISRIIVDSRTLHLRGIFRFDSVFSFAWVCISFSLSFSLSTNYYHSSRSHLELARIEHSVAILFVHRFVNVAGASYHPVLTADRRYDWTTESHARTEATILLTEAVQVQERARNTDRNFTPLHSATEVSESVRPWSPQSHPLLFGIFAPLGAECNLQEKVGGELDSR